MALITDDCGRGTNELTVLLVNGDVVLGLIAAERVNARTNCICYVSLCYGLPAEADSLCSVVHVVVHVHRYAQYTPPTPTRRNCFVASASAV